MLKKSKRYLRAGFYSLVAAFFFGGLTYMGATYLPEEQETPKPESQYFLEKQKLDSIYQVKRDSLEADYQSKLEELTE
jgi:hypothetical protein